MVISSKEKNLILQAKKIAEADLKINYGELGIYAGPQKHKQYWARDGFIASFGSCVRKDFNHVKKNLELFKKYQRGDGHIPARVEENFHALTVLDIGIKRSKPKALHRQTQPWASEVVDSNPWYIISTCNYIEESGDTLWLKRNKGSLKKAADWLVHRLDNKTLVTEGFIGNWSDAIFKSGNVLYTNVLTWKALDWLGSLLKGELGRDYLRKAKEIREAIQDNFWDEKKGYFIDWISKRSRKYKHFASDGNLLAVFFDLAAEDQAKRIFKFIDTHNLNRVPVQTIYPKLIWWNSLLNKLIFPMYRPTNTFTWWGCVSAVSRLKINDFEGSLEDIIAISKIILDHGYCPEVVRPNGKEVSLFYWESEKQIAWTAGMFIYAYNEVKKAGVL